MGATGVVGDLLVEGMIWGGAAFQSTRALAAAAIIYTSDALPVVGQLGARFQSANAYMWPDNDGFFMGSMKTELPSGTIIDRYGLGLGSFVAPEGTPIAARRLSPTTTALFPEPSAYRVVVPIEVDTGLSAPFFGQPGFGIQHKLPDSIDNLLDFGIIEPH